MWEIIENPETKDFDRLCLRPSLDTSSLVSTVQRIFDQVIAEGDAALKQLTEQFDGVSIDNTLIDKSKEVIINGNISSELKSAIQVAYQNISIFHAAQKSETLQIETTKGVICTQKSVPIRRVGIYIPGGTAPLFSTVLMLAIPAQLAACQEVVLCTPPDSKGQIHPAILYCASLCGINEIHLVGGAQAIAALAVGTPAIKKVDKIFGPGNQYVTAAKQLAQQYGVAIDMPAGPSEVLVFADPTCVPSFVAADLLAQAEHGSDSQVILVATEKLIIEQVNVHIQAQLPLLPRREMAIKALHNSKAIVLPVVGKAFDFINTYAPEHLIIASEEPEKYVAFIHNAGSVFLGNNCPESAGDYASGTNHTLPTNGWARSYSGVNLDAFMKKITFQSISKTGLQTLGKTIIEMAEAELLQAHANAVKIRLEEYKNPTL